MSNKNQAVQVEANEKHIMDFSMYAATRIDISNLDAKIDRNAERLEDKFDARIDKVDARIDKLDKKLDVSIDKLDKKIDASIDKLDGRIDKLDKKIDSNFKWTLALLIPIMLSGFGGLFYKDMINKPSGQTPSVATVQQK